MPLGQLSELGQLPLLEPPLLELLELELELELDVELEPPPAEEHSAGLTQLVLFSHPQPSLSFTQMG